MIDEVGLSDAGFRLLQAMVKLPPRNGRNSDAVARGLRMGKEKTNAARKSLREHGHWHARKRQNREGQIRDQRMASLVPLRTEAEVEDGWAAAEEAARLGKDTDQSRRLGVRILNSAQWQAKPAAGSPAPRPARRRPPEGHETDVDQTPLPVPTPGLSALTGPLASYAERAEGVLMRLRRTTPELVLSGDDARELAQIAGHYLLRGEGPETIRAVVAQGLPPEGVRSPRGFVRQRLLRYLPPLPAWAKPNLRKEVPKPEPRPEPEPVSAAPQDVPCARPGEPGDLIRQGLGWRVAFQAVAVDEGD
ncbi:hypothetical protein [Streptomyces gobiensis]|uniref:hypothetical protein n=1 Tax=Streptomyces gobiensis TaxID=2875706 RepID=UPI001E518EF1|nr:hypothetical protein [Streptomyces gobiensis]UGY95327.1 hypothetical protein test1122_15025 [Streptomyces gobiensis]